MAEKRPEVPEIETGGGSASSTALALRLSKNPWAQWHGTNCASDQGCVYKLPTQAETPVYISLNLAREFTLDRKAPSPPALTAASNQNR